MPNYLIPEELSKVSSRIPFSTSSDKEPKIIFLKKTEEKFFLNIPKIWEEPLKNNLGKIYEDGSKKYNFNISAYDGENIFSFSLNMLGIQFKDYLLGLLKFAKTISISVNNGLSELNYIICQV